MGLKDTALIGASVVLLAVGANQALQPSTPGGDHQPPGQDRVGDLSDADERSKGRMRDEASDHVDAEERRRTAPRETRPPEPRRPRVRLRLP